MDYGPICSLVLRRTTSLPPKLVPIDITVFNYLHALLANFFIEFSMLIFTVSQDGVAAWEYAVHRLVNM